MIHLALLSLVSASYIGEGLGDVAIDAPGVAYPKSWKGFPNAGTEGELYNILAADLVSVETPGLVPDGVNPQQCTPQDGQYPVILIPGTLETAYSNWAYMGPKLVQEGFCVYSFNHNPLQFANNSTILEGTAFAGDIAESAAALSTVVDYVLEWTGASKVDLVGHSQGAGALPFYYLKNLMQGDKVHKLIGLAPSLGTDGNGLDELFYQIMDKQTSNGLSHMEDADLNMLSMPQQLYHSPFLQDLRNGGLGVAGVEYINIATLYDDVLQPYTNCWFTQDGIQTEHVLLQDKCWLDLSDHIGFPYSSNAYQLVLNHLNGNGDAPIDCEIQLPISN